MLQRLVIAIAALAGIAATASLGFWQWDRGGQRSALHQAIAERARSAPVPVPELLAARAGDAALLHRPVVLRGEWVAGRTVFLDNRQMNAVPGFYVVTPLRLEGGRGVILVQRGWAPRNFVRRDQLPAIETPAGEVELHGRIAPPPAKLLQFGAAGSGPIRQNLDLTPFAAETRLALLQDVSVQQTGPASQGLQRNWPEAAAGRGPETNYGYAFQWWALCGLIAILYVWFQFIQPRRQAPQP